MFILPRVSSDFVWNLVIRFIALFYIQCVTTLHNSLLHILESTVTSVLPLLGSGFGLPTSDVPLPLDSQIVSVPQLKQLEQPRCFTHVTNPYGARRSCSGLKTKLHSRS
jgi:hypothetical protein